MASEKGQNRQMRRNSKPSRYVTSSGVEAEFEPGSRGRVLKNRLAVRRKTEMDRMEFEALVARRRGI